MYRIGVVVNLLESYEDVLRRASFEFYEPVVSDTESDRVDLTPLRCWRLRDWRVFLLKKIVQWTMVGGDGTSLCVWTGVGECEDMFSDFKMGVVHDATKGGRTVLRLLHEAWPGDEGCFAEFVGVVHALCDLSLMPTLVGMRGVEHLVRHWSSKSNV